MAFAALTIDLQAKLAKFETDLARAGSSMDGLNRRAAALSGGLKAAFGAASIAGIAAFAKSGIDAADALNDMSQRLGVSVKDLASFKLAAEQSGTSLEGIGTGIGRLTKSIGEAEGGNKALAKALNDLGITARDPKEAFFQLADAVQRIEDPSKRAALLSQVLGKSYGELVPLLAQGSDALRQSAAASETFAESMARLAPEADKFNDQLAILKQNAAGAAASMLSYLVPALNDVFERIGLLKDLIGAGGLFNTIVNTGGTSDIGEFMRRVRKEIELTQQAIEGKRSRGLDASAFEQKLKGLNAQLQVLIANRTKALMAPPQTDALRLIKNAGTADFSATRSGKIKKIDKVDLYDDEMARNAKIIADETERIADDYAFMRDVDLAQNTAEFTQQWIEAGRALEDEMRTPLENANIEFGRLDELLARGAITWETYTRAVLKLSDSLDEIPEKIDEMDTFAKKAAENIQDSFADFLFDPFDKGLDGMLKSFGQTIQRMIADAVAADLTKWLFGDLIKGGSGSGVAGNLFTGIGELFGFANGGVAAYGRPLALPHYAGGGIATSASIFGEAGPEAAVPLPDGRYIPVKMMGGAPSIVVNINGMNNAPDIRSAGGQVARQISGIMKGASRYG